VTTVLVRRDYRVTTVLAVPVCGQTETSPNSVGDRAAGGAGGVVSGSRRAWRDAV